MNWPNIPVPIPIPFLAAMSMAAAGNNDRANPFADFTWRLRRKAASKQGRRRLRDRAAGDMCMTCGGCSAYLDQTEEVLLMPQTFTKLVKQKIEERLEVSVGTPQASAEADARFQARAAPVVTAASDMIDALCDDEIFISALGVWDHKISSNMVTSLDVKARRGDRDGREGEVTIRGLTGMISFYILKNDDVWMRIEPVRQVMSALNMTFGLIPIRGDLSNVCQLIVRGCDQLADLLADVISNRCDVWA
jgi:hypothetical protein